MKPRITYEKGKGGVTKDTGKKFNRKEDNNLPQISLLKKKVPKIRFAKKLPF